jgi:hypothetical protein
MIASTFSFALFQLAVFSLPQSFAFSLTQILSQIVAALPLLTQNFSTSDGDPVALFDRAHGRWVLMQFAVRNSPFYLCFAVSQTEDATGAYHLFKYSTGPVFPDVSNSIRLILPLKES